MHENRNSFANEIACETELRRELQIFFEGKLCSK